MASDRDLVVEGLIKLQLEGKGAADAVATMKQIVEQARQVESQVGGFGKKTEDQFNLAAKGASYFNDQLKAIGATVAGYFAANTLIDFLRDSYVGFAKAEREAATVERQIRAVGNATEASNFRPFVESLQTATGQMADELIPAFQRAITVTRNFQAAQELVTIAAKYAASGVGDVNSNVDAFTRVLQTGQARGLAPFISDLKTSADGTVKLTDVITELKKGVTETYKPLDDAQAHISDLKISFDHLSKAVGDFLDKRLKFIEAEDPGYIGEALRRAKDEREQAAADIAFAQAAEEALHGGKSALDEEAAARDAQRAKDQAAAELKAKQDLLKQKYDLEEKNQEDILKASIALQDKGSKERLDLELQLLEVQKQAALKAARDLDDELKAHGLTGVNIANIEKIFAAQRSDKLRDFTLVQKPAGPLEEVDPEKQLEEIAAFEKKRGEIILEADKELAQLRLENSNNFERDRIEAQAAIEIQNLEALSKKFKESAELDAATKEKIERALAARIKQIQEGVVVAEHDLTVKSADDKKEFNRQVIETFGEAAKTAFANNKAVAVADAIINTAVAVSRTLAEWGFPEGVPLAAAVAALGAAQVATILATNPGSSGGGGGGLTASAPPAVRPVGSPTVAASPDVIQAVSGSGGVASGTTINIRNAYGDKRSMQKLARDIAAANRYDPKVAR